MRAKQTAQALYKQRIKTANTTWSLLAALSPVSYQQGERSGVYLDPIYRSSPKAVIDLLLKYFNFYERQFPASNYKPDEVAVWAHNLFTKTRSKKWHAHRRVAVGEIGNLKKLLTPMLDLSGDGGGRLTDDLLLKRLRVMLYVYVQHSIYRNDTSSDTFRFIEAVLMLTTADVEQSRMNGIVLQSYERAFMADSGSFRYGHVRRGYCRRYQQRLAAMIGYDFSATPHAAVYTFVAKIRERLATNADFWQMMLRVSCGKGMFAEQPAALAAVGRRP